MYLGDPISGNSLCISFPDLQGCRPSKSKANVHVQDFGDSNATGEEEAGGQPGRGFHGNRLGVPVLPCSTKSALHRRDGHD